MLVIPGNPGVAGYYIPFLRYLQRSLLPERADVFACSYIGHSTPRGASKVMPVTFYCNSLCLAEDAQSCGQVESVYMQEHRHSSTGFSPQRSMSFLAVACAAVHAGAAGGAQGGAAQLGLPAARAAADAALWPLHRCALLPLGSRYTDHNTVQQVAGYADAIDSM